MKMQYILAEMFGCKAQLNDCNMISNLLTDTAKKINAKQYGEASICYVPHGITGLMLRQFFLIKCFLVGSLYSSLVIIINNFSKTTILDKIRVVFCPNIG